MVQRSLASLTKKYGNLKEQIQLVETKMKKLEHRKMALSVQQREVTKALNDLRDKVGSGASERGDAKSRLNADSVSTRNTTAQVANMDAFGSVGSASNQFAGPRKRN